MRLLHSLNGCKKAFQTKVYILSIGPVGLNVQYYMVYTVAVHSVRLEVRMHLFSDIVRVPCNVSVRQLGARAQLYSDACVALAGGLHR